MQGWPQPLHPDVVAGVAESRSPPALGVPEHCQEPELGSTGCIDHSAAVLYSCTVVSTLSWSTTAEVRSSLENTGSSRSSCQRSYFE